MRSPLGVAADDRGAPGADGDGANATSRRPAPLAGVEIPLGTVWSEETVFRGGLQTLAARRSGPGGGRLLQAIAFGLWHIPDAKRRGTDRRHGAGHGVAGWVFGWLAERSGSLLAPMLAHLAINEAGAVAACVLGELRQPRGGFGGAPCDVTKY